MTTIRLALAQINTTVGDLDGNKVKILNSIARARELGVDLIAFQFGMLHRRGQTNGAAGRIDLACQLIPLLVRMAEEFLHHSNHVFVGMLIVIPKHDMISRLTLWRTIGHGL